MQSAAEAFARAEVDRIAGAVVDDLRARPANDTFGDVATRHLWDEYCWSLQEGPFDDDMGWDDVRLGSLSGAFEDVVRASIQTEVEKLPRHALVFLSARAFEEDDDNDEDESLGGIWIDGIVSLVLDEVNSRASRRTLDLIGPHRSDVIGYEVEGSGMVWSVVSDRGEALDLIASHCDALIDPEGDLSDLADEMVEAFMAAAAEDDEGAVVSVFLEHFEDEVRTLVREKDVVPSLEDMRAGLLDRLDA
ncbi:hypothetical protein ACVDG3_00495 [Meridianimarinicoccus sp. RP-17]|uniref:hypothetical protein n=1 Tax=Meridianimarinicoccus zhengii TaxID=2056810 RepID=UPI000DABB42B|nr:hypothetical protein [Phycocomes zhengii]